jgi:cellulose synthase/poly-beta-1,6-N-acetylglucosamine synthase-like glycosyltransferase
MSTEPFVSVVVAVRNGEKTIGACIESVLAQDYPKDRYEVLIVDNDSTDRTAEVIKRFPVAYLLEQSAHSVAVGRNRGIREAKGELVAVTDGDTVAAPAWLRRGITPFADPHVGCVAGEIVGYPPGTLAQRYADWQGALSQAWAMREAFKPFAQCANAFFRRSAVLQAGLFDASMSIVDRAGIAAFAEDADLCWRLQDELGLSVVFCAEAVVYHKHRETVSALLKQRQGYGLGSVLLYQRYRRQMGPRKLQHTYWDIRTILRRVGRLLGAAGAWAVSPRRHQAGEDVAFAWIEVLSRLAWKLGQLKGSLRYRVWYI